MVSKPKNIKTYIVHRNGNYRQPTVIGRYRIGARNEDEAMDMLKAKLGKHIKARVYYEEKDKNKLVKYGEIVNDLTKQML